VIVVVYYFSAAYEGKKEMDEQSFFTDVLSSFYRLSASRLDSLNTSSLEDGRKVYQMYRVEQPLGPAQILFAYHDDFVVGPTLRWGSNQPLEVWLCHRAELLIYLAEQHYPAPRVLLSQSGALIARYQQWNFLVTTYIDGDVKVLSPENMFLLGSALGQLHNIELPSEEPIGLSWWNDTYSIPHAIEMLASSASSAPLSQRSLCENMQKTLHVVEQGLRDLPEVIIHGDCWAPNGIRTGEQSVVLIDWECAGRGAAILDLGVLLLRCQYDQYGNIPEEIDTQHIASVVAGYAQWRHPSPQELDMLLEAIRFGIVWGGAWIASRATKEGWTPRIERLLARIQRGYDLAAPVARCARTSFAQLSSDIR
jgi:Ser/Thr protein kinase RdoA (MazF antagonist)